MVISIHQPEHLVWLGLLDKIAASDLFVIMDEVDFEKNYYQNRNKIRFNCSEGWKWLTVPVEKHNHKPINQVKINYNQNWQDSYLNLLTECYRKAPYFNVIMPKLEYIIKANKSETIFELNNYLLKWLLEWFNITTPIVYMSDLNIPKGLGGANTCLEICKKLKYKFQCEVTYLSGISGKDYLNLDSFKELEINVKFHQFFHAPYKQQFQPFIPCLSSIDMLMNHGYEAENLFKCTPASLSLLNILNRLNFKFNWNTLEMFGGDGSGHLRTYGGLTEKLDIWEIDETKVNPTLKEKYKICDSLKEIKETNKKYKLIIVDPPAMMGYAGIVPELNRVLEDESYVVLRVIKQSFNNNPNVLPTEPLEYFIEQFSKDFIILESWEEPREYYYNKHWLSDYAFRLKK